MGRCACKVQGSGELFDRQSMHQHEPCIKEVGGGLQPTSHRNIAHPATAYLATSHLVVTQLLVTKSFEFC
jgi:hypothetical protein